MISTSRPTRKARSSLPSLCRRPRTDTAVPEPSGKWSPSAGTPTRRGRLQVRRCDSRQSLGLEPFVSPQLGGSRRRRCPPPPPLPERCPEGIQPGSRSQVRNESVGKRKPGQRRESPRPVRQARRSNATCCGAGQALRFRPQREKGWALPASRPHPSGAPPGISGWVASRRLPLF